MSQEVIAQINCHRNYRYDIKAKRVVNLTPAKSDIDEFLHIQYILDSYYIPYRFEKEFHIQILNY